MFTFLYMMQDLCTMEQIEKLIAIVYKSLFTCSCSGITLTKLVGVIVLGFARSEIFVVFVFFFTFIC